MSHTNPPANRRFLRSMMVVIMGAGLVWLGFAIYNYAQTGRFNATALGIFLAALLALGLAGGMRRKDT